MMMDNWGHAFGGGNTRIYDMPLCWRPPYPGLAAHVLCGKQAAVPPVRAYRWGTVIMMMLGCFTYTGRQARQGAAAAWGPG